MTCTCRDGYVKTGYRKGIGGALEAVWVKCMKCDKGEDDDRHR